MAVDFKVVHNRTSEYRIAPERIDVRAELNGRHELPDIEWLIADILKNGQHTPVAIWNDGGTPVLAAGFSRWRAVSEINKQKLSPKPLELRCTYVKCNERSAFLMNISENRFRKDTTRVDDAHNVCRLMGPFQITEEEVAQIYFPTATSAEGLKKAVKWVKDTASLITLTPEAEKAVKSGRVKESAAVAISKLTSAQQKELLKKEGKVTAADAKAAKAAGKPPKAPKAEAPGGLPAWRELKGFVNEVLLTAEWPEAHETTSIVCVDRIALNALRAYVNGNN